MDKSGGKIPLNLQNKMKVNKMELPIELQNMFDETETASVKDNSIMSASMFRHRFGRIPTSADTITIVNELDILKDRTSHKPLSISLDHAIATLTNYKVRQMLSFIFNHYSKLYPDVTMEALWWFIRHEHSNYDRLNNIRLKRSSTYNCDEYKQFVGDIAELIASCYNEGNPISQAVMKWRDEKWEAEEFTMIDRVDTQRNADVYCHGSRVYHFELDRMKEMWLVDGNNSFTKQFIDMLKFYERKIDCKGKILDIICEHNCTDYDGSFEMQKKVRRLLNTAWGSQFNFF